ncbi:MAG: cytochrome b N-terminal domain-containing protein [Anaerolineales bacterium]|nr:cytochrome b N-terminal domain-containing protein [Anaerolineales bacterium]
MSDKIQIMRPSFFHHLHPPTIPAAQSRWRYTLGAGGTAIFLALILTITGALEMFYYIPTPDQAAISIQTITYFVPFGALLRNLHFWAAQLFIIVSAVHLVRVVFTGAYIPPRRFNYLLGLALFVISILLNFTGYILRWDQGIQWALVVGTNLIKTIPFIGDSLYQALIGGTQPGSATLIRFYAWHIFGLMLPAAFLVGWHAFRVRREGGIALPPPTLRTDSERITRNELVRREILAMLFTGSALLVLSIFTPAPIAPPIIEMSPLSGEVRAPWFFLWVQQMLKWGDPFFWGVLIPVIILIILILIPYIFPRPAESELGRWFPKSSGLAQVTLAIIAVAIIVLTLLALIPIK